MKKYNYFEKDRYNFTSLIDEINLKDTLDEVICYEDEYYDIEIYTSPEITKLEMIDILRNFNQIDNQVQNECENEAITSKYSAENYACVVGWIEILTHTQIEIGYFGACVNTQFNKKFIKESGKWVMCN